MKYNNKIINSITTAWNLYFSNLRLSFSFVLISTIISECFKLYAIRIGIDHIIYEFIHNGNISNKLDDITILCLLGIISILLTTCVYGFLICIGGEYLKQHVKKNFPINESIKNAFILFKKRFGLFLLICFFLSLLMWILANLLNILGILLVTSLTIILLPTTFLGNFGIFLNFYKTNFQSLVKDCIYIFQLGIIILTILISKHIIYMIIANFADTINYGIKHVILVFSDALTIPFFLMIMVEAFNEIKKN